MRRLQLHLNVVVRPNRISGIFGARPALRDQTEREKNLRYILSDENILDKEKVETMEVSLSEVIDVRQAISGLIGGLVVVLFGFILRRYYANKDAEQLRNFRKLEFTLDLHTRFNSGEVLKARGCAEDFVLTYPGKRFSDLRSTDNVHFPWLVAREYEFLSIAVQEKMVDRDIVAKYFFEIFMYWKQHFQQGYKGEKFELVTNLKELDKFFKEHAKTSEKYKDIEDRQQKYINSLLAKRNENGLAFVDTWE